MTDLLSNDEEAALWVDGRDSQDIVPRSLEKSGQICPSSKQTFCQYLEATRNLRFIKSNLP